MNDDPLGQRIRDTLRLEAEAVDLSHRTAAGSQVASVGPPRRPAGRRRWVGGGAVAVAGVLVAVFVALHVANGSAGTRVGVGLGRASTLPAPAVGPGSVPVVVGVASVPSDFRPLSTTFVSDNAGWVLGTGSCSSPTCLILLRTTDGGHHWAPLPTPQVPAVDQGLLGADLGVNLSVRFADPQDGWIYSVKGPGPGPLLWSTHDGGLHWQAVSPPYLAAGTLFDLEAAGGHAQLVLQSADNSVVVETTPVGEDDWKVSPVDIPLGAGGVPSAEVDLLATTGWIVENDRQIAGAARLAPSGAWAPWQPPCAGSPPSSALLASSPQEMVAVCLPASGEAGLFASKDGATAFHRLGTVPATAISSVATPGPGVAVVAGIPVGAVAGPSGPASLLATFDNGAHWQAVAQTPGPGSWQLLGFTSPSQGVAIAYGSTGTSMFMTFDGGHHWQSVSFAAGG